jgi:hypothetical protein
VQNGANEIIVLGLHIPLLVAAAALGSGLTLFGVLIQNCFETWRHRQRLKHEDVLKTEEREVNARRDVYLKATEELAKNFRYLNTFGDLSVSVKEHAVLIEKFGEATSKLHMVASEDTIPKLVAANEHFYSASLQLNRQRLPLLAMRDRVTALGQRISGEMGRHDQILQQFKQAPQTPENSAAVTHLLHQIRSEIEQMQKEEKETQDKIPALVAQLWKTSQEASFEYGKRLIEVNISIRRELALPLDENKYRELMTGSLSRARTELEAFTNDLFPPLTTAAS